MNINLPLLVVATLVLILSQAGVAQTGSELPMDAPATVMIRHSVEDYGVWKRGYDDADYLRKEHGILFASVHRNPEDPNTVVAIHRFRTLEGAMGFLEAVPPLMAVLGVTSEPEIWITQDVEVVTYE